MRQEVDKHGVFFSEQRIGAFGSIRREMSISTDVSRPTLHHISLGTAAGTSCLECHEGGSSNHDSSEDKTCNSESSILRLSEWSGKSVTTRHLHDGSMSSNSTAEFTKPSTLNNRHMFFLATPRGAAHFLAADSERECPASPKRQGIVRTIPNLTTTAVHSGGPSRKCRRILNFNDKDVSSVRRKLDMLWAI
jgi:hypothetical protein